MSVAIPNSATWLKNPNQVASTPLASALDERDPDQADADALPRAGDCRRTARGFLIGAGIILG
jgi:hypothetical protein